VEPQFIYRCPENAPTRDKRLPDRVIQAHSKGVFCLVSVFRECYIAGKTFKLMSVFHRAVTSLRHLDMARPLCALFSLVIGMVLPAMALNPDRQTTQYGHTAWRLDEGIFPSAPHAIAQTADGYLWIGTETGLVRSDGVRIVPWTAPTGQALASISIYSLAGTRDGGLWIGTGAGLASWKGEKLLTYPETAGRINSIIETQTEPYGRCARGREIQGGRFAMSTVPGPDATAHGMGSLSPTHKLWPTTAMGGFGLPAPRV